MAWLIKDNKSFVAGVEQSTYDSDKSKIGLRAIKKNANLTIVSSYIDLTKSGIKGVYEWIGVQVELIGQTSFSSNCFRFTLDLTQIGSAGSSAPIYKVATFTGANTTEMYEFRLVDYERLYLYKVTSAGSQLYDALSTADISINCHGSA